MHICIYTYIHRYIDTNMHIHIYTCTHIHICSYTHMCACTPTFANAKPIYKCETHLYTYTNMFSI